MVGVVINMGAVFPEILIFKTHCSDLELKRRTEMLITFLKSARLTGYNNNKLDKSINSHLFCILILVGDAKILPNIQFNRSLPRSPKRDSKNLRVEARNQHKLSHEFEHGFQFA